MPDFMFKVGDRVVMDVEYGEDHEVFLGQTGTVVDTDFDPYRVGVCWDQRKSVYHSCSGSCDDNHGWYVDEYCLAAEMCDLGTFDADSINKLFEI